MFLYKYKHNDDIFFRLAPKKVTINKQISLGEPVGHPVMVTSTVEQALSQIETAMRTPVEEEKEVTPAEKKMASSIISNFLKA
jgi:hypothetical protein